jgi:5-methylcytosine-specific restriction enzyme subunit McrC
MNVADGIILLYPHSDTLSRTDIRYASDDHVRVDVSFVDLKDADESIRKLLAEAC